MAKSNRTLETYAHVGKERLNNPPVGLVTPDTDRDDSGRSYVHDPHVDPHLSWSDKTKHTSFDVPTVSLHVHERIDPRSIISSVRKRSTMALQPSLFAMPQENPPVRQAIEFYKHRHNWTNRIVAGDSLLVMNSLIEKEGLGRQVQTVYIDPPYGIRYGSNFQPFVNKHDVKDRDSDLSHQPETLRAFRDTWEVGIHSFLTYLRDRLLLSRDLLCESGSCIVQISDENVHLVRNLMDEIFGPANFVSLISFRTKIPLNAAHVPNIADYLVWYAKNKKELKFRKVFQKRQYGPNTPFHHAVLPDGSVADAKDISMQETENVRYFRLTDLMASGYTESCHFEFILDGQIAYPNPTTSWKTTPEGIERLINAGRVRWQRTVPSYVFYMDDYPVMEITNQWTDTQGATGKMYAVQTATKVVERCILMSTDPGDLVFDPTCGSGTTAFVAEKWGRRWITCDTSRVAIALARQRLMTSNFEYFELAYPSEGVGSGFQYKTVPHITLGSIANNPEVREGMNQEDIDAAIARHAPQEILCDQPQIDRSKARVTGPFTVEAVPAPTVRSLAEVEESEGQEADNSIARTNPTIRQADWREELLKTGIRGKLGQRISFARLESLAGMKWLHADGETRPDRSGVKNFQEIPTAFEPSRVVVSFGPDHAPLEQRQVALAIEEAQILVPKPRIVVFAAFQFDSEAAKDIDETNWPKVTLLKAQMNADLLTDDLKKNRMSNESFWLVGQPDVDVQKLDTGKDGKARFRISVKGFDYYNTKTGNVESGGKEKIAIWMLDPDYDGRSLFPKQVFFPMGGGRGGRYGWKSLARNLKAEIDLGLIKAYEGNCSLPFEIGGHKRAAVKIVDDRGIESLRVVHLK